MAEQEQTPVEGSANPNPGEPTSPATSTTTVATRKPLPKAALWAIGVGLVVLLFFLQSWAAGRYAAAGRREAVARTVDGFGPLLNRFFLDQKFDRGKQLVTDIANSGGYRAVTLAGATGTVIATTDSTKASNKLDISKFKGKADVSDEGGVGVVRKLVELTPGGSVLGALEIEYQD